MLMQNFGMTNKKYYGMSWYFLEWSIGVEPSQDDFQKCACGATSPNTCVDTSYSCNCDANIGSSWHEDSGNLNDKNHLPVIQLRFGDTGSGEAGYHTLGKLRCYGMA